MAYDRTRAASAPRPPQGPRGQGDGCVVAVIRIPVRAIAFVVVLPLKLLWDALSWVCRALWRYVLAPPLRAFGRLLAAIWRYVIAPAGRVLIVIPAVWLWTQVLHPVLRAIGLAVSFVVRWVLVRPAVALWRYGLRWIVVALAWLLDRLVVVPLAFLWRRVLVPVGREVGAAVAAAWRAGAYVSRLVGRGIGWVVRVLVLLPIAFVWRYTGAPVYRAVAAVFRFVRREILHPVRVALADARRAVGSALFGTAREEPARVPPAAPHPIHPAAVAPPPGAYGPPASGAYGPPADGGYGAPSPGASGPPGPGSYGAPAPGDAPGGFGPPPDMGT